jgi:hypothetical protein
MTKQELAEKLDALDIIERDALESLILNGSLRGYDVNPKRLQDLGLIFFSQRNGWTYDGGPISTFFEVRLERNFA